MLTSLLHFFDYESLTSFIQQANEGIEAIRLFGIKLINPQDFFPLLARFLLNLLVTTILVRFLYYPSSKRKDYFFVFFVISTVVFLLCYVMGYITTVGIGFALGLFAIFGILRYRTDTIPIKEMTYLFLMVGIAVVNAMSNKSVSYAELIFINLALILLTWYLERVWMLKKEDVLDIVFEKIELIHPDRYDDLVEDLKQRTGLDIYKVSVNRVNFLRDTARLKIYYKHPELKQETVPD